MRKYFYFIIILNVFCAYYSSSIETIRNEFDGYTIYRKEYNILSSDNISSSLFGGTVSLGLQKLEFDKNKYDGIVAYSLILSYQHTDCIFIEKGESLILLIDGERLGFEGDGSRNNRDVRYGGDIKEIAWYYITPEQIKMIMNAKEVKVRIRGSQYFAERHFNSNNFEIFRYFYNRFCINP